MAAWWNYKQAADLPPAVVERMWRALDRIAEGASPALKPGYPDFMNKAEIVALAKSAVPHERDAPADRRRAEIAHERGLHLDDDADRIEEIMFAAHA